LSTSTSVAPFSPRPGLSTATWWVKVARPPPVPSSGFLPLSTVLAALAARTRPLRSSPFAVAPRRFAALFHAARALGIALQSFPFSRSRTRSRGPPASLWVRVRPPNGATVSMGFTAPFPAAPTSGRGSPRGLTGLGGWDDGSPEPLDSSGTRKRARARLSLDRSGSPDSAAGTPTSKPCSPRESVLVTSATLARGRSSGRCSPGFLLSPLELSPAFRGLGMRVNDRARAGPSPRPSSEARPLA